MNVSLTPELVRFVAEKLEEGGYASRSEVVRAGLRLLMEREELIRARIEAGTGPPQEPPEAWDTGRIHVPTSLWPHFPEYDAADLILQDDRDTVIGRLLQVESIEATRWLRAHVSNQELVAFLTRRRGRGLDKRTLRFWGLLLDVPSELVQHWVQVADTEPWEDRVAG